MSSWTGAAGSARSRVRPSRGSEAVESTTVRTGGSGSGSDAGRRPADPESKARRTDLCMVKGWRAGSAAPESLGDCSLLVPTYERPDETCVLLEQILSLHDRPAEVVFIDGSSGSQTDFALRVFAEAHDLPFELIYVRSAPGLTRQRNVGIDVSSGAIIYYLDDDCIPEPGYFSSIRRAFVEDQGRRIGAVCGTVLNEMPRDLPLRWRVRLALGLVRRLQPGEYDRGAATSVPTVMLAPFSGTRPVEMVPGGAVAYRRDVLRNYRFSLFFSGYSQGEDLEMSLRIGSEWRLRWAGDAHVIHRKAEAGRPPGFRHGRMTVRNRYFIWKRHSRGLSVRERVRFWADISFGILCQVAGILRHPTQTRRIGYPVGSVAGILACLRDPPHYVEPSPHPEYSAELAVLTADLPAVPRPGGERRRPLGSR